MSSDSMCSHTFKMMRDWEGDPSVINGTNELIFFRCTQCGEETDEPGDDLEEPDYDDRTPYEVPED